MKFHFTQSGKRMYIHFMALPFFLLLLSSSIKAQTDPLLITCPPAVSVLCTDDPYDPGLVGQATFTGGCNPDNTFVYLEDAEIASGCSYVLERTWYAVDECGSSASCTQIVTVIDDVPLTLTCPHDFTVSSCTASLVPQMTGGLPTIHDNCSEPSLTWMDFTVGTPSCCETFIIQRTWTAFDQCGNPASCIQLITVPAPNCDDGNPCTEDLCVGGTCLHFPVNCDDGDACTIDYCDAQGVCHNDPVVCQDDGDPCTLDICIEGVCSHVPVACPQPQNACSYSVCENGICVTHEVNCDDEDPCTFDECINGVCVYTPIDCNDGDPCTIDYCDGTGECHHDPVVCEDDGDPCTDDYCLNGTCVHVPIECVPTDPCMQSICIMGVCVEIPIICDDGDPCTTDECINGECVFTPINCDDGDPNTNDFCFEGVCIHTPMSCDDGNPCTQDILFEGICTHIPIACNDGDPCTTDACVNGECVFTPINCDDGDPNTNDVCISGVCVHTLITCDDGNPCTQDILVDGVCTHIPIACNDGNPCTTDACVNGVCVFTPINCDDNNPNTIDECANGVCTHTLIPCTDNNPCTVDTYVNGVCTHTLMNCDDGNPCTVDACVNGVCTHTPMNCDDGNPCTIDACANGVCTHTPKNCDDGNPCTIDNCVNGVCTHTLMNCNDGNPCTVDACVNGVCTHTPMNCNDGNPCTTDACANGVCTHTPIPGCGNEPPVADCNYSTYVFIDLLHPDYNGPGINNIYLTPASNFDEGSSSNFPAPVMEVKRVNSLISFNWTTNGACIDHSPNGVYNDADKGKVYRTCLPTTITDAFQWKSYKFKISDANGNSECSGWYMVIPYLNFNKQGEMVNHALTDNDLYMLQQDPPANSDEEGEIIHEPVIKEGEFRYFPNPGDQDVTVTWNSIRKEQVRVVLLDITGKKIREENIWAHGGVNSFTLDTRTMQPGSYILQFRSANEFKSGIWIKAEK